MKYLYIVNRKPGIISIKYKALLFNSDIQSGTWSAGHDKNGGTLPNTVVVKCGEIPFN